MALIEVVALHAQDAERAQQGGADRLQVGRLLGAELHSPDSHGPDSHGPELHCPELADVSAILRATDLPVRVSLRLSQGFTTQGGEFTRLVGLAGDYLSLGVEGFAFGFLNADLDVDVDVCWALADQLTAAPWTFDETFDRALDPAVAWRRLRGLPGLDGIQTAGSVLGLASGLDDLLALANADEDFAAMAIAAGTLPAEDVPWLVRSGIDRLHLAAAVRAGGSWQKAYVDPGFVRSWRLLLDDAVGRLGRLAPQAG